MQKKTKKDNFVWGGIHPFIYHPIVFHFVPDLRNKTILDCGCGKGIWGYLMRSVRGTEKSRLIGIDVNRKYLNFCKKHGIYDEAVEGDISNLPFPKKSVDFLICSEVIEHLDEPSAKKFLDGVDRVMKKGGRAIITTPNVNMETKITDGADAHHSLWSAGKFRARNYKVYGMGVKIAPGIHRWYTPFILALYYLFTPLSYYFPELGAYIIAVKEF